LTNAAHCAPFAPTSLSRHDGFPCFCFFPSQTLPTRGSA
jgi:hypothetical protein